MWKGDGQHLCHRTQMRLWHLSECQFQNPLSSHDLGMGSTSEWVSEWHPPGLSRAPLQRSHTKLAQPQHHWDSQGALCPISITAAKAWTYWTTRQEILTNALTSQGLFPTRQWYLQRHIWCKLHVTEESQTKLSRRPFLWGCLIKGIFTVPKIRLHWE